MQHADRLTVVHHDDSTTEYDDVRYTLTAAGVRILDADGGEQLLSHNDVLTTDAHVIRAPEAGR